jgi:hypothetical protein
VDLSWTDNASNESAYVVERSPDGVSGWSVVTSALPAGSVSFRNTGLAASTTYSYRVRATNAAGSSGFSNVATVTTKAASPAGFAESFPGADGSAWDPARWTGDTGTTASLTVQSGAGRMLFQNVSGARALATATMTPQADTDVLLSFRFPSTAARGYFYVFSRGSGNWSAGGYPTASYFLQILNDDGTLQLWKTVGGTTTRLAIVSGVSSVTTAKQWVRFRVQGSTLTSKIWTDGATEPTGWELTSTDTAVTTPGVLQLRWARAGNATASRDVLIDDIQVTPPGG